MGYNSINPWETLPVPTPRPLLNQLAERPQLDFELDFFDALLARLPDAPDVLRAQASNLTKKGRVKEGLRVDQKLVSLRPADPTAHYNLACRYAVLQQRDLAFASLRRAVELGYRDWQYMQQDRDLETVRKDPRFRSLVREFGGRA
jgi:tetratricopeptide (TPR) repeat protein